MSKHGSWKVGILIGTVAVCAWIYSIRAADTGASVQGVVKDSSGAPVSGAFVKLINSERHLTYMVISQAQGRYTVANVISGKYTAQGVGNGHQSEAAPVDVSTGRPATADVSLTADQAAMLAPAWPGRLPGQVGGETEESTRAISLPDGDGKELVGTRCKQCHDLARVVNNRADRAKWQETVQSMRDYAQSTTLMKDWTDTEQKTIVDYLAANIKGSERAPRPKPDSNSRLPRTLLQGENANYIIVDYQIPGRVVEPHEITLDARGNAWVSERTGGKLGKLDANSLNFSEVNPPPAASKAVHLNGIVKGEGDKLWLVDGGPNRRFIEFDSKTSEFNVFVAPKLKAGAPTGNTMRVHPDGTIWLSGIASDTMIGLNPLTKKFVVYDVMAGVKVGKRATPYGMAVAGDGKVWFAENGVDQMGRLDPSTGKIDDFPIPLKTSQRLLPRKVGYDKDGNIWVGLWGVGKLLKIDYKTTKMTIYTPPTENAGVYSTCGDLKNGYIWFSEQQVDKIARFDPKTEKFMEFPVPYAETDTRRIEVDQNNPNRVWYSGVTSNRIGYIELTDGNAKHL